MLTASLASTSGSPKPSRLGRLRLSTAVCFGVSVLMYVIAMTLGGVGMPWPIVITLLLAAAVVFVFSTVIALVFRADVSCGASAACCSPVSVRIARGRRPR